MKRTIIISLMAAALLIVLTASTMLMVSNLGNVYATDEEQTVEAVRSAFSGSIILYIGSPEAIVNDQTTRIDPKNAAVVPFINNGRTLMPISFVANNLGFEVKWQEADRVVILKKDDLTLEFTLDSKIMKKNGAATEMETAAVIKNGRTLVPIFYVSKALGQFVTYDQGLIVLDSERIYKPAEDRAYLDSLIARLATLPIVGSKDKFNSLMKNIATAHNQDRGELVYGFDAVMIADPPVPAQDNAMPNEAPAVSQPEADVRQAKTTQVTAEGGGDLDYSSTNIQVEGVDEADIIKTDGQYIYHLAGMTLNIIKANAAGNMEMTCSFDLGKEQADFYPQDMYVDGDKLCLIGMEHNYQTFDFQIPRDTEDDIDIMPLHFGKSFTKVMVYDITNKAAPKLARDFSTEGNLISSRKVDNNLYLIINYYMSFYGLKEPSEVVPLYHDSSEMAGGKYSALDFTAMRYFPGEEDSSMLIVCGLDLKDDKEEAKITSIIGSGNTVYMSRSALYIAKHDYRGSFARGGSVSTDATTFFKFVLDNGNAIYSTKGETDGYVLNQYSLDEYNDCLRVATTVNSAGGSKNALTVFDESMQVIGKISDMAPGEQVYSARFMGEKAFMVTFRTVDPLFAIDLSDPRNPKVLGELKIPGYSTYLHPYDENHLIGFGRDTEELTTLDSKGNVVDVRAVNRGLKLALFDISDMTNPKEISVVSIGDESTHSDLLYNPKAMLFSREKGFIAFPVTQYSYSGKEEELFAGAHVYDISTSGIKLRGKISHGSGNNLDYDKYYDNLIQRIIYIGDTFYSAANGGIQANEIKSLKYLDYLKY
ncbi:MAG: beta-propeller domain-containing protein [Clostridiales bacterium]|nr:beta-propeller domain-containing protein [Clostridiales bacterium]